MQKLLITLFQMKFEKPCSKYNVTTAQTFEHDQEVDSKVIVKVLQGYNVQYYCLKAQMRNQLLSFASQRTCRTRPKLFVEMYRLGFVPQTGTHSMRTGTENFLIPI